MIREAKLKDFQKIMSLLKLNLDTFSKSEIPAAANYIPELIRQKNKYGNFFVIVDRNEIVGCAGYSREQDVIGVYSFNWLAIHPDFKRRGLATELYNHIENSVKLLNARLFIANAGEKEPNRFFYKKMGFKVCGKIPKYYSNKKDLIWYYKFLQPVD